MELHEIKAKIKSTGLLIKLLHWACQKWPTHKLLDKLHDFLLESEDRVAEQMMARGQFPSQECIIPPAATNIVEDSVIGQLVITSLKELLMVIPNADVDPALNNMFGDLEEKISWWIFAFTKVN